MSLLTLLYHAAAPARVKVHQLLALAPTWLTGPLATDVFGAVGRELDRVTDNDLSNEFFIATTTELGLLTNWERDYGVPIVGTDGLAARRNRVLLRKRGVGRRNDADFLALVEGLILPTELNQVVPIVDFSRYVVYKPELRGQVANNVEIDLTLEEVGPAHVFLGLAPWDDVIGLPPTYLDTIHPVALDRLTPLEMDGPITGGGSGAFYVGLGFPGGT